MVQRDFRPPSFFHHSNWSGPLTNGLKYFHFWFRFRRVIRVPRSIILNGVRFRAESYCAESGSEQYHTVQSQFKERGFSQDLLQSALN